MREDEILKREFRREIIIVQDVMKGRNGNEISFMSGASSLWLAFHLNFQIFLTCNLLQVFPKG